MNGFPKLTGIIKCTISWFLISLTVSTCNADLIWLDNSKAPVSGRIVSVADNEIQFQRFDGHTLQPAQTIARNAVLQFYRNIDIKRLEALTPNTPQSYRQYAEELSSQANDPYAGHVARRLLVVAAANSTPEGRLRCLELLRLFSSSENQRRQLNALLVAEKSTILNSNQPDDEMLPQSLTEPEKEIALKLIQHLRRDEYTPAQALLAQKITEKAWSRISHLESFEWIASLSSSTQQTLSQRLRLVRLEIAIRSGTLTPDKVELDWSQQAFEKRTPLQKPTIESVCGINAAESIFRDGRWTRPSQPNE